MWPIVRADQLSGHQQDTLAQGLKCGILQLGWQTQSLEPVDEIVGEQAQVKVRLVGEEVPGGDGPQRIVAFELSND